MYKKGNNDHKVRTVAVICDERGFVFEMRTGMAFGVAGKVPVSLGGA